VSGIKKKLPWRLNPDRSSAKAVLHHLEEIAREQNREPADLLEEAWARYVEEQSRARLVVVGQENSIRLGLQESDTERLIAEYPREKRGRRSPRPLIATFILGRSTLVVLLRRYWSMRAGHFRIDISGAILRETADVLREKFQPDHQRRRFMNLTIQD